MRRLGFSTLPPRAAFLRALSPASPPGKREPASEPQSAPSRVGKKAPSASLPADGLEPPKLTRTRGTDPSVVPQPQETGLPSFERDSLLDMWFQRLMKQRTTGEHKLRSVDFYSLGPAAAAESDAAFKTLIALAISGEGNEPGDLLSALINCIAPSPALGIDRASRLAHFILDGIATLPVKARAHALSFCALSAPASLIVQAPEIEERFNALAEQLPQHWKAPEVSERLKAKQAPRHPPKDLPALSDAEVIDRLEAYSARDRVNGSRQIHALNELYSRAGSPASRTRIVNAARGCFQDEGLVSFLGEAALEDIRHGRIEQGSALYEEAINTVGTPLAASWLARSLKDCPLSFDTRPFLARLMGLSVSQKHDAPDAVERASLRHLIPFLEHAVNPAQIAETLGLSQEEQDTSFARLSWLTQFAISNATKGMNRRIYAAYRERGSACSNWLQGLLISLESPSKIRALCALLSPSQAADVLSDMALEQDADGLRILGKFHALRGIDFNDGGDALTSDAMLVRILSQSARSLRPATKWPLPTEVPRKTVSYKELVPPGAPVRVLGRTLFVNGLGIKFAKEKENTKDVWIQGLAREWAMGQVLPGVKERLGLQGDVPKTDPRGLLTVRDLPADVIERIAAETEKFGEAPLCLQRPYVALVYAAPEGCDVYLNAPTLSAATFRQASDRVLHDAACLMRDGWYSACPTDLYHNLDQGRVYDWMIDVHSGSRRHGAGRLHAWRRAVACVNHRLSGLWDFKHYISVSSKEKNRERWLDEAKYMGDTLFTWCLEVADSWHARQSDPQLETFDLADELRHGLQTFMAAFAQKPREAVAPVLDALIDFERMAAQMDYFGGTRYVEDLENGEIPEATRVALFGSDASVTLPDPGRARRGWVTNGGWLYDGRNADLGSVNGPLPWTETVAALYKIVALNIPQLLTPTR